MASKIVPPEFEAKAFSCPHCEAYSTQSWSRPNQVYNTKFWTSDTHIAVSLCKHCRHSSIWVEEQSSSEEKSNPEEEKSAWKMIHPRASSAPSPSEDMPDEIKKIYEEASKIVDDSHRGAAALLRLCMQQLMPILGEKSGQLDKDIETLSQKNRFPTEIIHSLDAVRVIGNKAVHPGRLTLFDDQETAYSLFTS